MYPEMNEEKKKRKNLKKSLRKIVRERSGGICEECKEKKASHMHHKTYENVPNELPEDLIHLCLPCHGNKHPQWKETYEREFRKLLGKPQLLETRLFARSNGMCEDCRRELAQYVHRVASALKSDGDKRFLFLGKTCWLTRHKSLPKNKKKLAKKQAIKLANKKIRRNKLPKSWHKKRIILREWGLLPSPTPGRRLSPEEIAEHMRTRRQK